ncbi:hypothetical protein EV361DRAFT_954296 [Lentinula raphanica]|uniref:Uncharacterized protein n=1 Tax=Lentinula raphanica TaxID=153919 RepID=A0AA38U9T2_9AGAR|nr:hypothetical protein F5878DRAFT_664160 [Lentinula raphanica]KAJ3966203.1 hypothetical protein EV361DRAFT_954296 [Lentinula raphanica]
MSEAQYEMIGRRQNSVQILDNEVESQEAEPSSGKGKGVDPQNWGAMDLDHDEPSPECRAQLHDMFEEFQAWQHCKTERIEAKYQAQIDEL